MRKWELEKKIIELEVGLRRWGNIDSNDGECLWTIFGEPPKTPYDRVKEKLERDVVTRDDYDKAVKRLEEKVQSKRDKIKEQGERLQAKENKLNKVEREVVRLDREVRMREPLTTWKVLITTDYHDTVKAHKECGGEFWLHDGTEVARFKEYISIVKQID